MNTKVIMAIGAAVIAGLVAYSVMQSSGDEMALPKLSVEQVQEHLDSEIKTYEENGFSVAKEGQKYRVSVANTQEVERFLVAKVEKIAPTTYAAVLREWKKSINAGEGMNLVGLTAEVGVIEDDQGAKVEVRLVALSDAMQAQLNDASSDMAQEVAQINAFISQGKLFYVMRFDENGEVAGIALGDIQESFTFQGTNKLTLSSLGLFGIMKGDLNSTYQMVMEWNTLQMKLDMGAEGEMNFVMQGLKSVAKQADVLNAKSDTTIAQMRIDFEEKNYYGEKERMEFDFKGVESVGQTISDDKTVALKSKTAVETIQGKVIEGPAVGSVNVKNFVFDFSLEKLEVEGTKALMAFLSNIPDELDTQHQRQIANALERITQAGFEMRIDKIDAEKLNFAYEEQNITLEALHFELKVALASNKTVLDNYVELLQHVVVSGKFSMGQKGYETLRAIEPEMFTMADGFKVIEDKKVVFDFSFAQGQALINGKPFK